MERVEAGGPTDGPLRLVIFRNNLKNDESLNNKCVNGERKGGRRGRFSRIESSTGREESAAGKKKMSWLCSDFWFVQQKPRRCPFLK